MLNSKLVKQIESFKIVRVCNLDINILKSMTAPVIDGKERRNIIDIFCSEEYVQDDYIGNIASFVVISPEGLPLAFFSLRCGELFKETSKHRMEIAYNANTALNVLMDEKCSQEDHDKALKAIQAALKEGLNIDDITNLTDKNLELEDDKRIDNNKYINRVLESYPAVELKLFGVNKSAERYWQSLGFPDDKKMGETLFWSKVVLTIENIRKYVGCQYMYLFAADKEPDGQLVQYYKVRLGFNANANMSANKPYFDWSTQFLFRDLSGILKQRDEFMSSFNC